MMALANRKKIRVGDLLEVQTSQGISYVQYVGRHPEYGDVIRVLPDSFQHRPPDFTALLAERGYLAFYAAQAAVTQGLAEIVGSYAVPAALDVPRTVRRPGARERTGEILTWVIESDGHETVRKQLGEAEKQLPIAVIWDHELLIRRMAEVWSPEKDG